MGSATWRDLVCFFPLWGLHYFVSKCIEIGLVLSDTWFGRFHDLHLYFPHLALLRHVVLVPRSPKPHFSTMVTQGVDFFCLLHANPQHCPTFVEYRRTGQMIGFPECRAVSGHALSRNVGKEGCTTFTTPGEIEVK